MKPEIVVSGGTITTTAGQLTAKDAIEYIKQLKKAIKEVKAKYCARGHLITPESGRVQMLANGYKTRVCRVCRAEYDEGYYEAHKGIVQDRSRDYYHREKRHARTVE